MAVTLVSVVSCMIAGLATWRPEDYSSYKIVRVLGGRRIAGSAWLPQEEGPPQRIGNAQREAAVEWFVRRTEPYLAACRENGRRAALVPYPDPGRVVGAPPSPSRLLAQALADAHGLRLLDVLRWRQPMPRCRALDVQTLADNLLITGSPMQMDSIVVVDCLADGAGIQAAASRLRRSGSQVVLAISAGRAVREREACPFTTQATDIEDVATADL